MLKLSEFTKELIDQALKSYDFTELNSQYTSRDFDLLHQGRNIPVKNVFRAVNILRGYKGDLSKIGFSSSLAKSKLLKFGYGVFDKKENMNLQKSNAEDLSWIIERYKEYIKKEGLQIELYKWERCKKYHGFLDMPLEDFYEYIYNTDFSTLVYPISVTVFRHMAAEEPVAYRDILRSLGDSNIDLQERIITFIRDVKTLYLKYETKNGTQHDERTAATFLAYHDANQYPIYKSSFYGKFCKELDVKKAKSKYRYLHYIELLRDFIGNYIVNDDELLELIKTFKNTDCHPDNNHYILAQDIIRTVLDVIEEDIEPEDKVAFNKMDNSLTFPLNQILYGPPGTGKTYESITLALDILRVKYDKADRKDAIAKYKREHSAGNVVFTTFHQSMGYEDFVEGIKPVLNEDQSSELSYEVKPGILMQMAAQASYDNVRFSRRDRVDISFDDLYELYIDHLQQIIDSGTMKEIKTFTGLPFFIERINRNDSIITLYKGIDSISRSRPKRKPHLRKLYDEISDIKDIKNVKDIADIIGTRGGMSSYWAVFNDLLLFKKSISKGVIDNEGEIIDNAKIIESFKNGEYNNIAYSDESPRKVIIIDEINRGNVSAIFGELITLLEHDKRIGKKNEILTALPYSPNASFGLPPNLYIIGTMNTADRSVEALDTALRRRFEFTEKMPLPDVLMTENENGQTQFYGYNLDDILLTINRRIEALIDRDHTIGHSYFFDLENEAALFTVFRNKIIPLMQEYFYNDYSKIGLVLGSGFVEEKAGMNQTIFAKFDSNSMIHQTYDASESLYELKHVHLDDFEEALHQLMT